MLRGKRAGRHRTDASDRREIDDPAPRPTRLGQRDRDAISRRVTATEFGVLARPA